MARSTSSSKDKTNRTTLSGLNTHVDKLDARLKRADTITRKSVKVLEAACEDLVNRLGKQENTSLALTQDITRLTEALTQRLDDTRETVRSDLQAACSTKNIDEIYNALTVAHERLGTVEDYHAQTVSNVNSRIARLATIIDKRLQTESREREALAEHAQSKFSQIDERMDTLEADTANALKSIGDKIVDYSESRGAAGGDAAAHASIDEAVSAMRDTGAELRTHIDDRIASVERNSKQPFDAMAAELGEIKDRLSAIETAQSNIGAQAQPLVQTAPPIPASVDPVSDDNEIYAEMRRGAGGAGGVATVTSITPNPYASPTPGPSQPRGVQTAAFKETPPVAAESNVLPYTPGQGPVEYDPSMFEGVTAPDHAGLSGTVPPPAGAPSIAPPPPPLPEMSTAHYPAAGSNAPSMQDLYGQGLTHKDIDTMDAARPALDLNADTPSRFSRRNLKVAGIALLLTGATLIAGKAFLGGDPEPAQLPGQDRASNSPTRTFTQNNTDNAAGPARGIDNSGTNFAAAPQPGINPQDASTAPLGIPSNIGQTPPTLEEAAADGNSIAQFQLGMTRLNSGDKAEGVRLIRLAANQGQAAAQFRLAKLYEFGDTVTKDEEMSRKLLQKSANGGNAIAMHELGLYHANAMGGLESDMKAATDWFERAAEFGVIHSAFNLALLSETGDGVPQSLTDAYTWYGISAKLGDQEARGQMERLKTDMAAADLARAEARIKRYEAAGLNEQANGIFRQVPWATPAVASGPAGIPEATPQIIKDVQIMLNRLGYDAGTPDGVSGPNTRKQIRAFQSSIDAPETGKISPDLYNQLAEQLSIRG